MKAWRIPSFGIDKLSLDEVPTPQPGPGEALVEIHAVSLNYRDLMTVKGQYNPRLQPNRIPCSDGAGLVKAVGAGVTRMKAGDRVAGIFMQNWIDGEGTPEKQKGALGGDIDGTLAEAMVLREEGVVPVPEHLSFEEAATLPCAGVTAWKCGSDRRPDQVRRHGADPGHGRRLHLRAAIREGARGAGAWHLQQRPEAGAGGQAGPGRRRELQNPERLGQVGR